MKTIFSILLIAFAVCAFAQGDKYAGSYICQDGRVHFFASTPFENISPVSNTAVCALNTQTKKVQAKVRMNSFVFANSLMQEHFNENYIESEKYPYGILEAEIVENIDYSKDGVYDITLKGTFEVHGVKQEREIKGKLTVQKGQPVSATAEFEVKLVDHNIKIPTAVVAKIAEVVKVDVNFKFKKYHK
jgi:polyisoprenoid-binding protein YceI